MMRMPSSSVVEGSLTNTRADGYGSNLPRQMTSLSTLPIRMILLGGYSRGGPEKKPVPSASSSLVRPRGECRGQSGR